MKMLKIMEEYKQRIRHLELERDLYRRRAIDEVRDHHKDATDQTATFDVDNEVLRHLTQN